MNKFVCMVAYTDYMFDGRVRREAELVASRGFKVLCLTPKNGAECRRFTMNGVDVRELAVDKYTGKSIATYIRSYVWFTLAASAACLQLLARNHLDIVHIHNLPDFLVAAAFLPRLAGCKVVLDIHDSMPETFASKFHDGSIARTALWVEEKLSTLVAHKVICVNDLQRDALVARGLPGWKACVCMNAPDPTIFTCSDPAVAAAEESFDIVYHGTMAERLGVDLIIRAIARLRDRVPQVRLHLWGRGDDLSTFCRLAHELDVEDRISFNPKGYPLHELPDHLRGMHVGIVGNRRSAATNLMLPVKLMEYVSLRIPAVAPRLPAIAHYFSPEMVAYYEPEDVESMADSLYALYADPDRRERQAQQAAGFLDQYGWARQGAALSEVYERLASN